uniref:Translation factor GUF1 homolog, mitochondrial n=1 Tax=Rhodosorus marinus TaxID=101924 RepID=A0A7S2ZYB7_9RHOD|mmetsp:Transcript_37432/g.149351  ORF Transcript_37432/g.149351 Transcript_37432/m.149351 type:complete len:644 (+) Transcript_37432:1539-3470(+)|eukprot:CAMPEP_0113955302 /NCGR_PEP_ID=MMETSP0011_2-20120614/1233_1 /TAXON_ID=101924 /ORGANISM="Rhodosorus marinus" /LENGTH=643 /DNA_ID=CAMNT_0000964927 /DNA_START=26 /DNA_END=1957 /DNA_ORIENTATION=+ /assembly_acc=CAM_ASM_000156
MIAGLGLRGVFPPAKVWSGGWRRSLSALLPSGEKGAERISKDPDLDLSKIRNFSIIAHVDHGKSTLADQLMRFTNTVDARRLEEGQQILDDMDLEKERGITIKMRSVRMNYINRSQNYQLNLIDTPGHVDFSYEVSRSLAAVEGALLVIDASQGVQAQTVANVDLAIENDLEIFAVLNKIDLPHAETGKVLKELEVVIGLDPTDAILISAKNGFGIDKVLQGIVDRIPHPTGSSREPLKALVFDSYYDVYKGVVVFVRLKGGRLRKGDKIQVMSSKSNYTVEEVGTFTPNMTKLDKGISSGEVGYVMCGAKQIGDIPVGDTITLSGEGGATEPLPGYKKVKPMVFCGIFPIDGDDFKKLRTSVEKLKLNDASLDYQVDNSSALGMGFRCGFLGLLHMDIVIERLEREYDLSLLCTTPSVTYRVVQVDGSIEELSNPSLIPKNLREIQEPFVKVEVMLSSSKMGAVIDLFRSRRATLLNTSHLSGERTQLSFEMPLVEVITDLHDSLKSVSRGYASMDYQMADYRPQALVKMSIAVAETEVGPLSTVVPRSDAHRRGKELCRKLAELIPRHQFKISVQAKVGGKVVASDHINPFRKDVTSKCYGGDVTRKKKLLDKQKKGKKRMRQFGRVDVPNDVFRKIATIK